MDFSGPPYYDDSDHAIKQNYVRLLAVPGRALQAREFTQIQTIIQARIRRLADSIFNDGDIIEGIVLTVDKPNATATISAGKLYAWGDIWNMEAVTLTGINVVGESVIGVELVEPPPVTYQTDPTLRDPAQGYDNYNMPGCDRYQMYPRWTTDEGAIDIVIFRLMNGDPINIPVAGQFKEITDAMARRTFDESGHFIVTGLEIKDIGQDPTSGYEDYNMVKMDPGKAFVRGYEVIKPVSTWIHVPKALDFRAVNDEPTTFFWASSNTFTLTGGTPDSLISSTVNYGYGFNPMIVGDVFIPPSSSGSIQFSIDDSATYTVTYTTAQNTVTAMVNLINAVTSPTVVAYSVDSGRRIALRSPTCNENSSVKIISATPGNTIGFYGNNSNRTSQYAASPIGCWAFNHTPGIRAGRLIGGVSSDPAYQNGLGTPPGFTKITVDASDKAFPACVSWAAGNVVTLSHFSVGNPLCGSILLKLAEQPVKSINDGSIPGYPGEGAVFPVIYIESIRHTAWGGTDTISMPAYKVIKAGGSSADVGAWVPVNDPKSSRFPGDFSGISYTVYTEGTDFRREGSTLKWDLGSPNEPVPNSYYTVVYAYNKILADEAKVPDNGDVQLTSVRGEWYLDLSPSLGPSSVTQVIPDNSVPIVSFPTVDYLFYLARRDLIAIDSDGTPIRIEGKSDIPSRVEAPQRQANTLTLAMLHLEPNSTKTQVSNFRIQRVTMEEIKKLRDRMNETEYNDCINLMKKQAESQQPPELLVGIMGDGFVGFNEADTSYREIGTGLRYNACIDLWKRELILPYDEETINIAEDIDSGASNYQRGGFLLMNKFKIGQEEIKILEQKYGTEILNINPYMVYAPDARITIEPQVDNWINTNVTQQIQNLPAETAWVNVWHDFPSWITWDEIQQLQALWTNGLNAGEEWWTASERAVTFRVSTSTSQEILENAATYMREREISIKGEAFEPNKENLKVKFDGQEVFVTSATNAQPGHPGWIKADSWGRWEGTFMVPGPGSLPTPKELVRCGTVTVQVVDGSSPLDPQPVLAQVNYTATGTNIDVIDTTYIHTIVIRGTDPLAQTFSFDYDVIVTKVGIYLASKPSSRTPLTVQIRDVVNGYPGPNAYAEKVIYPDDPIMQVDPVTVNAETKIEFDAPVYLEALKEYALVLMSTSDQYTVGIGTLGQQDLVTHEWVAGQPYSIGNLFTSSNNTSWTAHQSSDLKFNIYSGNFVTNDPITGYAGYVTWNNQTGLDFTRFVLAVDWLSMAHTRVSWEYSTDNGYTWNACVPYLVMDAGQRGGLRQNQLKIRAKLYSDNTRVSPLISLRSLDLHVRKFQTSGDYFGKSAECDGYNFVRQTIKVDKRQLGASWEVMFQTEEGGEWILNEHVGNDVPLSSGFYMETYEKAIVVPPPDMTSVPLIATGIVGYGGQIVIDNMCNKFSITVENQTCEVTIPTATYQITGTPDAFDAVLTSLLSPWGVTVTYESGYYVIRGPQLGWRLPRPVSPYSYLKINTIANNCYGIGKMNITGSGYLLDKEVYPGSLGWELTHGAGDAGDWYFRITALVGTGETTSEYSISPETEAIKVTFPSNGTGITFYFDRNFQYGTNYQSQKTTFRLLNKVSGVRVYACQGSPTGLSNLYYDTYIPPDLPWPKSSIHLTMNVVSAGLAPPSVNTAYYDVYFFKPRIRMIQGAGYPAYTPRIREFTNTFKAEY